MMPRVMVPASPNGLPMAKTFCPTDSCAESASVTGCRFGASICSSARSCVLSVPTTLAE